MIRWCWLACLTVLAWEDITERKISLKWMIFIIPAGVWNVWSGGIGGHLAGIFIGIFLLGVSAVTEGALGNGDGLFFLFSSLYLNFGEMVFLFLGSMGIGSVWSMIIFLKRRWRGQEIKQETIPLVACAWLAGVWLVCQEVFL